MIIFTLLFFSKNTVFPRTQLRLEYFWTVSKGSWEGSLKWNKLKLVRLYGKPSWSKVLMVKEKLVTISLFLIISYLNRDISTSFSQDIFQFQEVFVPDVTGRVFQVSIGDTGGTVLFYIVNTFFSQVTYFNNVFQLFHITSIKAWSRKACKLLTFKIRLALQSCFALWPWGCRFLKPRKDFSIRFGKLHPLAFNL